MLLSRDMVLLGFGSVGSGRLSRRLGNPRHARSLHAALARPRLDPVPERRGAPARMSARVVGDRGRILGATLHTHRLGRLGGSERGFEQLAPGGGDPRPMPAGVHTGRSVRSCRQGRGWPSALPRAARHSHDTGRRLGHNRRRADLRDRFSAVPVPARPCPASRSNRSHRRRTSIAWVPRPAVPRSPAARRGPGWQGRAGRS